MWERIDKLKQAFAIVIESDVQVYKVLTWIAQSLFILLLNTSKIKSNEIIIKTFEKTTLYKMRDMLLCASKKLDWLEITGEQRKRIDRALQGKWDENRVIGQVEHSEFYMKKGAKASISDWVNKMNNLIKRVMGNESFNG